MKTLKRYLQNKNKYFIVYHNDIKLFTWSSDETVQQYVKDPIIYVTTPQNMTFFESESLGAIGLNNNYIKLTKQAADKYTSEAYLTPYHLEDNLLTFTSINSFIDGYTKNLWLTIQWFGTMIVAITFIVIAMLYTIAHLIKLAYYEMINIKLILGYSLFKIYRLFIFILIIVSVIEIIVMMLCQSKLGIIYMAIISIVQFIIFYYVIAKNKFNNIIYQIK